MFTYGVRFPPPAPSSADAFGLPLLLLLRLLLPPESESEPDPEPKNMNKIIVLVSRNNFLDGIKCSYLNRFLNQAAYFYSDDLLFMRKTIEILVSKIYYCSQTFKTE